MEVGVRSDTFSDSVAEIIGTETDVEPCSLLGKPVYMAMFLEAKMEFMEWTENDQEIPKFLELTNRMMENLRSDQLDDVQHDKV